jgi:DNA modification methylase
VHNQILVGDVRQMLQQIPNQSVQCVVTSPPYWGLRDYGTALWIGGDQSCDHLGKPMATKANINRNTGTGNDVKNATAREFYKFACGKCGAQRQDSQIGLEQTPQEYVAQMVKVFREVLRVLADDGVLWLNIGDSYAGSGKGPAGNLGAKHNERHLEHRHSAIVPKGLKPKDLVGIPWRLAFALQDDGWYLRQDIIWAKPNPMPESVRDRCTKSHEYVFMLTKSSHYYYDNDAIKEPALWAQDARADSGRLTYNGKRQGENGTGQEAFVAIKQHRNKRDVWTIPTKPFKGAHFAVMPEALVEPCILASSKPDDVVLDPFTGSGTVGVVALRHNRSFVGVELNPEYAQIAKTRIENTNDGLFNYANVEVLDIAN